MEHSVTGSGEARVVAFSGRLTFADHAAFRRMIGLFETPGLRRCTFDLARVEFVDSAALGMLLLARESAVTNGVELTLRGATGQVRKVMEVAKFATLFRIED